MNDEEVMAFYAELEAYYGETLVNFEHYPRQFATQVRLYKYYKEREVKDDGEKKEPEVIDFT
jgi:hypothetical protein